MNNDDESVFQIVQRLVKPISTIAEMMRVGDADQIRLYQLSKLFLSMLTDLGEDINQAIIDADSSEETRERIAAEVGVVIFSLKDYLMAAATAIYDRSVNAGEMDTYADGNATAMFITRNQLAYGANHEPTVRTFLDKVNLNVVTQAARNEKETRVRELIQALYDGIPKR